MLAVLRQPVPSFSPSRRSFRMCLFAGLAVFSVLFFLNLLGTNNSSTGLRFKVAALFGVVAFIISFINAWLLPYLLPKVFDEAHWDVEKEILFFCWMILTIAMGNVLLVMWLEGKPFSLHRFSSMVAFTGLVGIVPITASVLLKQKILLKKYAGQAKALDEQLHQKENTTEIAPSIDAGESAKPTLEDFLSTTLAAAAPKPMLELSGDNQQENLTILVSDLVAIHSSDNYVRIFYKKASEMHQVIFRGTLKKMEESLSPFSQFYRCHRTYIVNLDEVFKISGNAQGYKLHVNNMEEVVPVSRSLNAVIGEKLLHLK